MNRFGFGFEEEVSKGVEFNTNISVGGRLQAHKAMNGNTETAKELFLLE